MRKFLIAFAGLPLLVACITAQATSSYAAPAFQAQWQAGNIGQHYYTWRYQSRPAQIIPPIAPTETETVPPGMRTIPSPLYGLTLDDISGLATILPAVQGLAHMPTTRLVFDRQNDPAYYATAISQLHPLSYLLGMLLDSSDMAAVSLADVQQRTSAYLAAFGTQVDIWEIGNEINGEWLGTTADVTAKMTAMYDTVHNAGKRTALTLYYNGLDDTNNCYRNPAALMFRWAQANIPARMLAGLDYVFISYYDQDCPGVSKDWTTIFTQLHALFPNSKVGFGENGTSSASDPLTLKQAYMDEYYLLTVPVPGYVGGHFWWYWREDCVPVTNGLWAYLNADWATMPVPAPRPEENSS